MHAKCFDPLGLAMPVKMTGNLLFRQTLQAMKVGQTVKNIPWDQIVPSPLLDCWLKYFAMLEGLRDVSFPRSVKPAEADDTVLPD